MPGLLRLLPSCVFLALGAIASPAVAEAQLVTWTLNGTIDSDLAWSPDAPVANVSAGRLSKTPALTPETFANAFSEPPIPCGEYGRGSLHCATPIRFKTIRESSERSRRLQDGTRE